MRPPVRIALFLSLGTACSGSASGPVPSPGDAGPGADAAALPDASPTDAAADVPELGPTTSTTVIHAEHRAVPGRMFGGWGPHLGHLLRRSLAGGEQLWFVDDACAPGTCSVDRDERLDYLVLDDGAWRKVASQPLPAGVQQNTASVLSGDVVHSLGVDVSAPALVECTRDLGSGASTCTALALDVGPYANYVGAAVSPGGSLLAWLTNVGDGGGGSFRHYADYGGGWNGPRTGGVGGYNDASYVNVAFDGERFVMLGELVAGLAPDWSFVAGVGRGDVAADAPVTWATPFAAVDGDLPITTNDALIDPETGDLHLVVRLASGAAATWFQAAGGALEGPVEVLPASPRVRLVRLADGAIVLVRAQVGEGLSVTRSDPSDRRPGAPVHWLDLDALAVPLPEGYEDILAIYTEAPPYPASAPTTLDVALVGAAREHEVLHARVAW